MDNSVVLLLVLVQSVMSTSQSFYPMNNTIYCVSDHSNCNESLHCDECHPLMWYTDYNHTQAIPNNTDIVFLQNMYFLNSGQLKFLHKKNLRLLAAKNVKIRNGRPSPGSVITCQENSSVFILFSSYVHIQGLTFDHCGGEFNGLFATMYFLSSFNVTISELTVTNSLGYSIIIDNVCQGSFQIFDSLFANSKCTRGKCDNSGNLQVLLTNKTCPQPAPVTLLLRHSQFVYDHPSRNFQGKNINFLVYQPMVTVIVKEVIVSNGSAFLSGNVLLYVLRRFQNLTQVNFSDCFIQNGFSSNGGGVYITFTENLNCSYDGLGTRTLISFSNTHFESNHAKNSGGALYVDFIASKAFLINELTLFNCTFINNSAHNGGALYITQQKVFVEIPYLLPHLSIILNNCTFINNKLRNVPQQSGDGIVTFHSVKNALVRNLYFSGNKGTALFLIKSSIEFEQKTYFLHNKAPYGAAIHVCETSVLFLKNGSNVIFINNTVTVAGGAIYARQSCLETTPQCFYQPIIDATIDQLKILINLTFIDNTAGLAGDAVYGGSVDNCFTHYKFSNTSQTLFNEIFHISPDSPSNVTSDPYGVCFCDAITRRPNCTIKKPQDMHKFPGEEFKVSVAVVGQTLGIVPALVSLQSPQYNADMTYYRNPPLPKQCQDFSVAVFSPPNATAKIKVVVKQTNPVKEKSNYYRLARPTVHVHLRNCPWIFQFDEKTNSCDCNEVIKNTSNSVSCDITSQSIRKGSKVWIGCSPGNNDSDSACSKVEVSSRCLPTNCRDSSHLSFRWFNLSDQCVDEREGRLCGCCKSNYSLSLGPRICVLSEENCSIYVTVLLTVALILAGVLLVCFLTVFNFTVAEGTINGLLFYANCVHAKQDSFFLNDFGSQKMSFFRVFIAWLNLDLGFQVCFYSGMTAYQKAWLELGFVLYLFLLGGVIVCLSRRSIRFTRLVGRNVVPVLATIALIAYPKIIRNCIMVWHCRTDFKSTDNLSISMWYSDETLSCFTGKHLPLFIFSILLFAVALLYTLCLFFIQCLQRGTGCFALKWINKLKPFFDASSGPCRDHYRFWPGLLLFARLALYVSVRTVIPKYQLHFLIGIGVLVLFFAFIFPKGVYRKWQFNFLELSFFFNLILASTTTIIVTQQIVASASIGLAAATFLLILVYHTYKRVRGTRWWKRLLAVCRKKLGRVSADHEHNRALFEVADEREPLMKPNLSTGSN